MLLALVSRSFDLVQLVQAGDHAGIYTGYTFPPRRRLTVSFTGSVSKCLQKPGLVLGTLVLWTHTSMFPLQPPNPK